eukprot:365714-Chlamydomonas_euryale.AAC.2
MAANLIFSRQPRATPQAATNITTCASTLPRTNSSHAHRAGKRSATDANGGQPSPLSPTPPAILGGREHAPQLKQTAARRRQGWRQSRGASPHSPPSAGRAAPAARPCGPRAVAWRSGSRSRQRGWHHTRKVWGCLPAARRCPAARCCGVVWGVEWEDAAMWCSVCLDGGWRKARKEAASCCPSKRLCVFWGRGRAAVGRCPSKRLCVFLGEGKSCSGAMPFKTALYFVLRILLDALHTLMI